MRNWDRQIITYVGAAAEGVDRGEDVGGDAEQRGGCRSSGRQRGPSRSRRDAGAAAVRQRAWSPTERGRRSASPTEYRIGVQERKPSGRFFVRRRVPEYEKKKKQSGRWGLWSAASVLWGPDRSGGRTRGRVRWQREPMGGHLVVPLACYVNNRQRI
jgi:hypothetical protein